MAGEPESRDLSYLVINAAIRIFALWLFVVFLCHLIYSWALIYGPVTYSSGGMLELYSVIQLAAYFVAAPLFWVFAPKLAFKAPPAKSPLSSSVEDVSIAVLVAAFFGLGFVIFSAMQILDMIVGYIWNALVNYPHFNLEPFYDSISAILCFVLGLWMIRGRWFWGKVFLKLRLVRPG